MLVKINNHIGDFELLLFDDSDHCCGRITNIISLDDVRRQIKEQNLSGYYLLDITHNSEFPDRINIDRHGRLDRWPAPAHLCIYENIITDLLS